MLASGVGMEELWLWKCHLYTHYHQETEKWGKEQYMVEFAYNLPFWSMHHEICRKTKYFYSLHGLMVWSDSN